MAAQAHDVPSTGVRQWVSRIRPIGSVVYNIQFLDFGNECKMAVEDNI